LQVWALHWCLAGDGEETQEEKGSKQAGVPHREAFQRMNYLYQVSSACEICVIEKKGFACHKPCKPLSVNIHQIHVEFKVWTPGCVRIVMRSQDGSGYTRQNARKGLGKNFAPEAS